jgi:serine-type D-Ala-D-Ala carboxypeptidase/endopeptidase (penicillin-binding protein 4)
MKLRLVFFTCIIFIISCSPSKQIAKSARHDVIDDSALYNAHVGISIYEPATGKYLYNYQGDKYFVPASNTKIPTCYAAMKYLGDSLVGLKYGYSEGKPKVLVIQPTGDPSFLHPYFKHQPVWTFFEAITPGYKESIAILDTIWRDERWGSGWSWNDYDASYMAERNSMPVFGNIVKIELMQPNEKIIDSSFPGPAKVFKTQSSFFDNIINEDLGIPSNSTYWNNDTANSNHRSFEIKRDINANRFEIKDSKIKFSAAEIPFVTADPIWNISHSTTKAVLADTLDLRFGSISPEQGDSLFRFICPDCKARGIKVKKWHTIHSQPTDSVLKPMMHSSDNFFAEQSLLMVSNEMLGVMNDAKIIDTLLKTDFKDLPQKPRWADGSGLSRYNLFTPQDMVAILNKMEKEFGMERIKEIFATGGEGTITNYYKSIRGFIFAKTGTLSGVVALSGFLYTKKNRLLIFSVLVNNHNSSATQVRRAVEKFIVGLREFF